MDDTYDPPTTETRTVYGLQLQVRFYQIFSYPDWYCNRVDLRSFRDCSLPKTITDLQCTSNIEMMSKSTQKTALIPSSPPKTAHRSQNSVSTFAIPEVTIRDTSRAFDFYLFSGFLNLIAAVELLKITLAKYF